eukprot:6663431-Pyramimonas_sp.AAC.1
MLYSSLLTCTLVYSTLLYSSVLCSTLVYYTLRHSSVFLLCCSSEKSGPEVTVEQMLNLHSSVEQRRRYRERKIGGERSRESDLPFVCLRGERGGDRVRRRGREHR